MDLLNKNKSSNLILLLYFLLLPFVFFSTILDPFLLARQLLTTILLFFLLFILAKNKTADAFTIDKTAILFLGFIVFSIISFSKSQIPELSHAVLSKYLIYLLFFITIRHLLVNDLIKVDSIKSYVILFGLLSISIATLAFIDKTIAGQNLFRKVDFMSGTFSNKNLLSSILFFCLPFYFVGISISRKIKIISVAAIILTIMLLILLRTRSVLIALSVFLFLIVLFQIKTRFSKKVFYSFLVLLITTATVSVWYLFSVKANFHSSVDIKTQYFYRLLYSGTFYERLEFWQQAIYIIKDNFFSGIGVGNWINTYPKYGLHHFSDPAILNGRMMISNPHNDFLWVLSEIGIFGFLCYLGIFISIFYQAYWLLKNEAEPNARRNAGYFLFFIIGYLIVAFFDFPLTRIEHQIMLLVVFSIINAKYLKANSTLGFKISSKLIYAFSFLLMFYSTTILLYRINSEKHLLKALEAEKKLDNATASFEFNKAKNSFTTTDNYAIPIDWHIGRIQYTENHLEESLESFSEAYKINPYSLVVNNELGSSCIKNGNTAEGLKHYKEALTISPKYEDARLNLAATYYNSKEYELAFQTIDQCDVSSKNKMYRQILTPIVEKKLNETLIRINNHDLNSYLQSTIKTENNLVGLYFDYRKNNLTFDKYLQNLIH